MISGLPTRYHTDKLVDTNSEALSDEDQVPLVVPSDKFSSEEKELFWSIVRPAFERNLAIKPGTFCNLPEAVVHLDTGNNSPVWRRQYPIAKSLHEAVDKDVQEWLENGIIMKAPANSQWNSSLLTVHKKDADTGRISKCRCRTCIDPRPINVMIPSDNFIIPMVNDILEEVAGAKCISTIDLEKSFHQLPLNPEDRIKTSFTWNGVRYMFIGTPFGLKPISSVCQRLMTIILHELDYAFPFVDDIVTRSFKGVEDNARQVVEVLNRLTKANLRVSEKEMCLYGN